MTVTSSFIVDAAKGMSDKGLTQPIPLSREEKRERRSIDQQRDWATGLKIKEETGMNYARSWFLSNHRQKEEDERRRTWISCFFFDLLQWLWKKTGITGNDFASLVCLPLSSRCQWRREREDHGYKIGDEWMHLYNLNHSVLSVGSLTQLLSLSFSLNIMFISVSKMFPFVWDTTYDFEDCLLSRNQSLIQSLTVNVLRIQSKECDEDLSLPQEWMTMKRNKVSWLLPFLVLSWFH